MFILLFVKDTVLCFHAMQTDTQFMLWFCPSEVLLFTARQNENIRHYIRGVEMFIKHFHLLDFVWLQCFCAFVWYLQDTWNGFVRLWKLLASKYIYSYCKEMEEREREREREIIHQLQNFKGLHSMRKIGRAGVVSHFWFIDVLLMSTYPIHSGSWSTSNIMK